MGLIPMSPLFNGQPQLHNLEEAIARYCATHRTSGAPTPELCHELASLFKLILPNLARELIRDFSMPDQIVCRYILDFAVEGLNDRLYAILWKEYFSAIEDRETLAKREHYTARTINRKAKTFAHYVTYQLWLREKSVTKPTLHPKTLHQRRINTLMTLGLDARNAEILLEFCQNPNLTRAQVRGLENINITENTLKTHIRRTILPVLNAFDLSEAKAIALQALRNDPLAEWPDDL